MTQEALSEKIGISRNQVSNLERGITNLSYKTLCDLCEVLDVCSCELICGAEHKSVDDNIIALIKHLDESDKLIVYKMLVTYKEAIDDLKKTE